MLANNQDIPTIMTTPNTSTAMRADSRRKSSQGTGSKDLLPL
jgi:hypothetical protein